MREIIQKSQEQPDSESEPQPQEDLEKYFLKSERGLAWFRNVNTMSDEERQSLQKVTEILKDKKQLLACNPEAYTREFFSYVALLDALQEVYGFSQEETVSAKLAFLFQHSTSFAYFTTSNEAVKSSVFEQKWTELDAILTYYSCLVGAPDDFRERCSAQHRATPGVIKKTSSSLTAKDFSYLYEQNWEVAVLYLENMLRKKGIRNVDTKNYYKNQADPVLRKVETWILQRKAFFYAEVLRLTTHIPVRHMMSQVHRDVEWAHIQYFPEFIQAVASLCGVDATTFTIGQAIGNFGGDDPNIFGVISELLPNMSAEATTGRLQLIQQQCEIRMGWKEKVDGLPVVAKDIIRATIKMVREMTGYTKSEGVEIARKYKTLLEKFRKLQKTNMQMATAVLYVLTMQYKMPKIAGWMVLQGADFDYIDLDWFL